MQQTRKRRGVWKVAALVMTLGLVLAACGNGDDPAEEPDADAAEEEEEEDDSLEEGEVAEADPEAEVDESAFYFDKELEIIVPFSTGGGTDTQARFMAPFLANFVPGNPAVGVFNIAGAGGTIGNNQWWNERDPEEATSLLFSSASSFLPWIFGEPALDLDYTQMIGTAAIQTGGVVYVNPATTGIESPDDFADAVADGSVSFVAGEQTPDSLGLLFMVAYELLEMDHNVIMGFEGRGPARVSFEQGDLGINWDTTAAYEANVQELVANGDAVPVFSVGQIEDGELVRDPVYNDIPHFGEIYEQIHGEAPSGELFDAYKQLVLAGFTLQKVMWLHQDAPQEAIDEMLQGFADMVNDPDFADSALDVIGDYDLVTGDGVAGAVATLVDFPEDQRGLLIDWLVENYDYVDPRG